MALNGCFERKELWKKLVQAVIRATALYIIKLTTTINLTIIGCSLLAT